MCFHVYCKSTNWFIDWYIDWSIDPSTLTSATYADFLGRHQSFATKLCNFCIFIVLLNNYVHNQLCFPCCEVAMSSFYSMKLMTQCFIRHCNIYWHRIFTIYTIDMNKRWKLINPRNNSYCISLMRLSATMLKLSIFIHVYSNTKTLRDRDIQF